MRRTRPEAIHYYIMLIPAAVVLFTFSIYPLLGSVIAFKDFRGSLGIWGSPWAGLMHFRSLFAIPTFGEVLGNTLTISVLKHLGNLFVPFVFAILLNESRSMPFKRSVQTVVYLPYFLSWVILAGVMRNMFSADGLVNMAISTFDHDREPFLFFANNTAFPMMLIGSEVWKNFGFNAIVYLAALAAISPSLYESAEMDGAGRLAKMVYITVPSLIPTLVLLGTLGLQSLLNAGFEQVLNLYNPLVYESGDILDTYIYRMGLVNNRFDFATAVGLVKSVVSLAFIYIGYKLADRYAGYRMF